MPMELILFPDVELWATSYLRAALAEGWPEDVYVDAEVPERSRARMVVVRRDGGPQLDEVRETARLTIRVWAPTHKEAADLAAYVRALIKAGADGNPVARVRVVGGPSRVNDPAGPMRLLTAEVVVRGSRA